MPTRCCLAAMHGFAASIPRVHIGADIAATNRRFGELDRNRSTATNAPAVRCLVSLVSLRFTAETTIDSVDCADLEADEPLKVPAPSRDGRHHAAQTTSADRASLQVQPAEKSAWRAHCQTTGLPLVRHLAAAVAVFSAGVLECQPTTLAAYCCRRRCCHRRAHNLRGFPTTLGVTQRRHCASWSYISRPHRTRQ